MATSEQDGDSRAALPGGVWRHRETGQELVSQPTAKFGNPQAAAYQRMGFEYVGPADTKKVEVAPDPTAPAQFNVDSTSKSVAELEQDLAAAKEREAAAKKVLASSNDTLAEKSQTEAKAEKPKADTSEKGGK